jgi:mannose-6-phosphate isomerase-like protein (cupin superfamily)
MNELGDYIKSGIIEAYVLGTASIDEIMEVEKLATTQPEVQAAIDRFSNELEDFALANAIEPDPIIKPLVMATIDYMNRMQAGEVPSFPPLLNEKSTVDDYSPWLSRNDLNKKIQTDDVFARLIGYTPSVTTAIVWLQDMAPQEVHHNEYERFLIVEGTCDIIIESEVHSLVPGNYIEIPLHVSHSIKVTSKIACKVVLQRVAA